MARCGMLLAEGPGGTLEEGGVCLPGTSVLLSAGFFNTWFPWRPAAAVHSGQGTSPRAGVLWTASQSSAADATLPRNGFPRTLQAASSCTGGADSQSSVGLEPPANCSAAQWTTAAPHPTGYGSQLCWGESFRVVAAPNTCYSSLQFLLFTGQSSIPPILSQLIFYIKLSLLKLCGIFVSWLDPNWDSSLLFKPLIKICWDRDKDKATQIFLIM